MAGVQVEAGAAARSAAVGGGGESNVNGGGPPPLTSLYVGDLFLIALNFTNPANASRTSDMLNFTPLNNKPVRIMYSNRDPSSTRTSAAANIFIKNLDKSIDNKALHDTFSAFGNVISCKVAMDSSGQSKGYGYMHFEQQETAQDAIKKLNEEDLSKVFGEFGLITSTIVMREEDGRSKCFGFVDFLNPDAAARAVKELNRKKFDDQECGKPLYVAHAQRKEDRKARLQAQFFQMGPGASPTAMPRMHMFPPGAPALGQQLFYAQAPPALIPPQPGFGYPQVVPGMRPAGGPMPNLFMLLVHQGSQQQAQRPVGHHGGQDPGQLMQQPMHFLPHQMMAY